MRKNSASRFGFFNQRALVAFALCSVGFLLAMLSLAATTPAGAPRANASLPPDRANFLSTFSSKANRLPSGVPLPPGTQFSVNGQGDPSSSSPSARFPEFAGRPLRLGTASGANSLGNPVFANQQPASLTSQPAGAFESMPLAPAAAGGWSIVTSPNTSTAQENILSGVTCLLASDCWAVGNYLAGNNARQTLIERWDGTSWAIVTSPNTSASQINLLLDVTCVSASECWAVGYYLGSSNSWQTLIERWDGTSWAIVTSPNTNPSAAMCVAAGQLPGCTQNNFLEALTCVSASDCWAVGFSPVPNGNPYQTLIERWDGASWAIVSSPNTIITDNDLLYKVMCVSASECWAVGYYEGAGGTTSFHTLIERWDGTSWAIVSSPNTSATQHNFLYGVTCLSASDCWAVGYYLTGSSVSSVAWQTLIEQWDGTSWAIVSSPNTSPTQNNFLFGVTCVSASECWAVGHYYGGSPFQTLIERWDGTSWAIVTSPNPSVAQNYLTGVTCVSASDCWAVGYYSNGGGVYQTLIEEFTIPVQLASVVSELTHGSAGPFDVNLPLTGTRGVECRSSASLGAGNYTIVFTFANTLTSVAGASVTSGTGMVSSNSIGTDPHQYIVNLTGVTNAQYITVTLANVNDSAGNSSSSVLGPSMGVLIGDVNASGVVTSGDTNLCKAQALRPVTNANFRNDINASGAITTGDANLIKQNALHSLPSPP